MARLWAQVPGRLESQTPEQRPAEIGELEQGEVGGDPGGRLGQRHDDHRQRRAGERDHQAEQAAATMVLVDQPCSSPTAMVASMPAPATTPMVT